MSGFTKGPWKIAEASVNRSLEMVIMQKELNPTKGRTRLVCLISSISEIEEVDKANARLIAAAPELHEALENIMSLSIWHGIESTWLDKARAALAKVNEVME